MYKRERMQKERSNINLIGAPEGENRGNGVKAKNEETIDMRFPKLRKDIDPYIQYSNQS